MSGERGRQPYIVSKVKEAADAGKEVNFYLYKITGKTPNNFIYKLGNTQNKKHAPSDAHCLQRMILTIVNEASRCIEEGIADSPEITDIGLTMGLGFPKGGPLKYADKTGINNIVRGLDELREKYGDRFECSGLLRSMTARNERFYTV